MVKSTCKQLKNLALDFRKGEGNRVVMARYVLAVMLLEQEAGLIGAEASRLGIGG